VTTEWRLLAQIGRTSRLSVMHLSMDVNPEGPSGRASLTLSVSSAILVNGPVQNAGIQSGTAVNQKRITNT